MMIKERPIIMTGNSPKAIQEDRKTQTRRLWGLKRVNVSPDDWELLGINTSGLWEFRNKHDELIVRCKCPYGKVGERLWCKETFAINDRGQVLTKSDKEAVTELLDLPEIKIKWTSSLFMPRRLSRILLEITGERVERVQEITRQDIWAEGCPTKNLTFTYFRDLWNSINAKRGYGWDTNCWVWVISFGRVE